MNHSDSRSPQAPHEQSSQCTLRAGSLSQQKATDSQTRATTTHTEEQYTQTNNRQPHLHELPAVALVYLVVAGVIQRPLCLLCILHHDTQAALVLIDLLQCLLAGGHDRCATLLQLLFRASNLRL